jgi:phosphate transport system protein
MERFMEIRTQKDISQIREKVVQMAKLVETSVRDGVDSFLLPDTEKAKSVIGGDRVINMLEMEIDRETVACLVLNAPVAGDLRLLFCIQKMNKDLERIGDHAVNIAQASINVVGSMAPFEKSSVQMMASHAITMLRDAVECFTNTDPQLALQVLENDDQVDDLNRLISKQVIDMAKHDVASVDLFLELLRVSKNLERIADLSTNIAEDVIFYIQAIDVRHHNLIPSLS